MFALKNRKTELDALVIVTRNFFFNFCAAADVITTFFLFSI